MVKQLTSILLISSALHLDTLLQNVFQKDAVTVSVIDASDQNQQDIAIESYQIIDSEVVEIDYFMLEKLKISE